MPRPATGAGGATNTDFLGLASNQLGVPYVWGGESPKGFDCSGLVQYVLGEMGITAPRTSEEQWAWVQRVTYQQLQPGDLIFEQWPGEQSPGHVAIYAGKGQIIEAAGTGIPVHQVPWSPGEVKAEGGQIVGYGRVPGLSYSGGPVTLPPSTDGTTGSTPAQDTAAVGGVTGALKEAGTLVHDVAQSLNWAFELVKPGQGSRLVVGGVALGAGVAAVKMYRSPSAGSTSSAEAPLAILATGIAITGAYMALRPWPVSNDRPIRPASYVADILSGHAPAPGPAPGDDTTAIEAGLWAITGIWAASHAASALGNAAKGIGGIMGVVAGIIGVLKNAGKTVAEVPAE